MKIEKRKMNKIASEVLLGAIIFLVVIILFGSILILFIYRFGKTASMFEQLYSKQIALMIDYSLTGTNFSLDISKLYEVARENNYNGELIKIDNNNHNVFVKLTSGKGYRYKYFSDADVLWNIKPEEKRLYVTILSKNKENVIRNIELSQYFDDI
ncbi:MAG: hypothetical protein QXW97_01890 [Candidatus Pacearchaeota archaeon]